MVTTPLLINGEEREGAAGAFPVYDPAYAGTVIGHAAAASADDALDAVTAANQAWPAWAALSAAERTAICLKALEGLDEDADERAEILSRENGKVRFEAAIDLMVFAGRFHQAAQYAPELDQASTSRARRSTPRSPSSRPASSRSSTRSTGRWPSSRRRCPPR